MENSITLKGFKNVNLSDMVSELEENRVKSILLDFCCPINKDVELFLHNKAIEFSKQSLAKTHLIFCSYKSQLMLVAYFTLANKFIQVEKDALSKTLRKKITKFGSYDHHIKGILFRLL